MDVGSVSDRLSSETSVSDRLSHSALRRGTAESSQETGSGRRRDDGPIFLQLLHLGLLVKKNALPMLPEMCSTPESFKKVCPLWDEWMGTRAL